MSLLSYLDWNDVEWTDEMNEEILKIDGLPQVLNFLSQNAHENYKSQAA